MHVSALTVDRLDDIVEVLVDAFDAYPVMQWVLGVEGDYERRLRILVRLFAQRPFLSGDVVLGVFGENRVLLGVALTKRSVWQSPARRSDEEKKGWRELGDESRHRYDVYIAASDRYPISTPHFELRMLGVRRSHQGRGCARALVEAVHELAESDSESDGVCLTTESERNLPFYARFGYQVLGYNRVDEALGTWTLYRSACRKASGRFE